MIDFSHLDNFFGFVASSDPATAAVQEEESRKCSCGNRKSSLTYVLHFLYRMS